MAGMSGFEATRLIRKDHPDTKVVFLSMYDDEDYLAECVDMGASGYILKDCPSEQLVTAIREVPRGGSYLSPRACSPVWSMVSVSRALHPAASPVSVPSPNASGRFSKCWPKANP
jgi:DNA-binding NarL/FixJ family response regulator